MKNFTIVCSECHSVNNIKSETEAFTCSKCQADLDHPFAVEVNDENCTIHIAENDIAVLVDFYSTTCGPYMAMYDDYEDAALGFGSTVRFLKINTDKYQEVARKYGVSALPTIIAFKSSKEVNRISKQLSQVELNILAQSLIA
ncbi:thioredoxin domain-containing protein [Sulfurimonas sp.]|uniref:thioredoxin family protein n=1 Tax=Sulfurimonas sp. TaxID=2022749 RepID=UPI0026137EB9|nr:thioredoxin domain-containing protein [Sulfurimonas sp.]